MRDYARTFNAHVRSLIAARGLTLGRFITIAHGHPNATGNVYPVLSGNNVLTAEKASKWAQVLGVSAESLLEANRPVREAFANLTPTQRKHHHRRVSKFSGNSFRSFMEDLFRARGLIESSFAAALGMVSSGDVNQIINRRRNLTKKMAERWSTVLAVPAEELLTKFREPGELEETPLRSSPKRGRPPARLSQSGSTPSSGSDEGVDPPVTFTVNDDGTANLRLNLADLPISSALKVVAVLELPELFREV